MSLDFLPVPTAYDDYYQGMVNEIPAGSFYLQALENLPLSTFQSRFYLITDSSAPVKIYLNNRLVSTHIPKGQVDTIEIGLFGAPTLNFITVTNGVDDAVQLIIAATNIAKQFAVYSKELYEYAGYTVDTYSDLIRSVWSSFLVEYQLPWSVELPDVRSMHSFAVKVIANCLYGEYGRQGGVTDLVTGFCSTTPVITAPVNPEIWQPDLYQPQTSGKDIAGFNFNVWLPNLCLNQWLAFFTLMNNRYDYKFLEANENKIVIQHLASGLVEQHLFDNTESNCSIRGLLDFLGCMDNVAASGFVTLHPRAAFCAWANPMDMTVEFPGIGGRFWDSGTEFDGDWGDFDSIYDIDDFSDWWAGVSTVKYFDFGSCFDQYTATVRSKANLECCQQGPDTLIFTTEKIVSETTSSVSPHNPLFGGDDPGLLYNPYFGVLNT